MRIMSGFSNHEYCKENICFQELLEFQLSLSKKISKYTKSEKDENYVNCGHCTIYANDVTFTSNIIDLLFKKCLYHHCLKVWMLTWKLIS